MESKFSIPNEKMNNDAIVNSFLNKNISLESLIENEIFKNSMLDIKGEDNGIF